MMKNKFLTLQEIQDEGFAHGFVFGKYTEQVSLNEDLKAILDNSKEGIQAYMRGFNMGFKQGMIETHRTPHEQLEQEHNNGYGY